MAATMTAMLIQAVPIIAPPAPPAPPIVFVAPPARFGTSSVQGATAHERYVVDVEVRAGGETLWSGPMTVATMQSTNFTRRLAEPAPDDCGTVGYVQPVENSLFVQLGPERQFNGEGVLGVSVKWGRTLPGTCPLRSSTRSVELNQAVTLVPGRTVVLNGDADLTVRLRRR